MSHIPHTNEDSSQPMNEELSRLLSELHHEQDDWYANIFHQYPEAIVICQTESGFPSTIIECNMAFEQSIKQHSIELIGRDFMSLLDHGEKRKFLIKALGKSPEESSIQHLPIAFRLGNGKQQTFALSITELESKQGTLSLVHLKNKREKQKVIEHGAEQLHRHLKQIFFSLKENDILLFNYVSQSSTEVLGYSDEQLLLNPFLFWFNCHPEDFDHMKKIWHKKKKFSDSIETRFLHKDGHMIWLHLSIILHQEGHKTQRYLLAQDISHTKKLDRLEEKKNKYRHLLLHSAKQLLRQSDTKSITALIDAVGHSFAADRIGIYAHNKGHLLINHNYFAPSLNYDDISHTISAQYYLDEFYSELTLLPLILCHPEANCKDIEQKHYSFLKSRHLSSMLLIPIQINHEVVGIILCTNQHYTHCWDRSDMFFLHELSEIIKSYLPNYLDSKPKNSKQ